MSLFQYPSHFKSVGGLKDVGSSTFCAFSADGFFFIGPCGRLIGRVARCALNARDVRDDRDDCDYGIDRVAAKQRDRLKDFVKLRALVT